MAQYLEAAPDDGAQPQPVRWVEDNVLKPFANGTGVIQVYDTIADKALSTYKVPEAATFSPEWAAQTISGAAGAVIPYVIAAKATGFGMMAAGEGLGLRGVAARVMASETVAQIAGAGLYEAAQKPADGQTRWGNAAGTMAGFALFSGGNVAISKLTPAVSSAFEQAVLKGTGRVAVGAVGGLGSYETANYVSGTLGSTHKETWDERFKSMAQGGFVNLALPPLQEGASKIIDAAVYSRPGSKGFPVQREIHNQGYVDPELLNLVHDNALARVKRTPDAQPLADVLSNRVILSPEDGAAKLAHEMTHLELARTAEPTYIKLAGLARSKPELAERAFYALRADMEVRARESEGRVAGRATGVNGTAEAKVGDAKVADTQEVLPDLKTIGNFPAVDGKTYADVWKGEWAQFKADPTYRPPVEYSGIVKTTRKYEGWMKDQLDVVGKDLDKKHVDMASDPFKFLRATYYRWAKTFPKVCEDLMDAPKVKSVGDLHVDNFGTWLNKLGRLIWGVNDFDEAYKLPYTNDLVRLLTSANLMRKQDQLHISLKDASDTVLEGYTQALKDGGKPFELNDADNARLAQIARSQMPDGGKYWDHLLGQMHQRTSKDVPRSASRFLQSILPSRYSSIEWGHRQAGEGSLGRERYVAVTTTEAGHIAGEAKAFLPSANDFVKGKESGRSYYDQTVDNAVRSPDPYVKVGKNWIVRRLAPDHAKIELGELPRVADEKLLLWAMGYETANIHLGTKGAAKNILADLDDRPAGWLADAVKDMTKSTMEDYSDWKKYMDKKKH